MNDFSSLVNDINTAVLGSTSSDADVTKQSLAALEHFCLASSSIPFEFYEGTLTGKLQISPGGAYYVLKKLLVDLSHSQAKFKELKLLWCILEQFLLDPNSNNLPNHLSMSMISIASFLLKAEFKDEGSLLEITLERALPLISVPNPSMILLKFIGVLLDEFSRVSRKGFSFAHHQSCKNAFQHKFLLGIFHKVSLHLLARTDIVQNTVASGCPVLLKMMGLFDTILHWPFSTSLSNRKLFAKDDKTESCDPLPESWKGSVTQIALLDVFFQILSRPDFLSCHHSTWQCLLRLASIGDGTNSSTFFLDDTEEADYMVEIVKRFIHFEHLPLSNLQSCYGSPDFLLPLTSLSSILCKVIHSCFGFSSRNDFPSQQFSRFLLKLTEVICMGVASFPDDSETENDFEECLTNVLNGWLSLAYVHESRGFSFSANDGISVNIGTFFKYVVKAYVKARLYRPNGFLNPKINDDSASIDMDIAEKDAVKYESQLQTIGLLAKNDICAVTAMLGHLILEEMKVVLSSTPDNTSHCCLDNLHWLILIAKFALTDVYSYSEKPFPSKQMIASYVPSATTCFNVEVSTKIFFTALTFALQPDVLPLHFTEFESVCGASLILTSGFFRFDDLDLLTGDFGNASFMNGQQCGSGDAIRVDPVTTLFGLVAFVPSVLSLSNAVSPLVVSTSLYFMSHVTASYCIQYMDELDETTFGNVMLLRARPSETNVLVQLMCLTQKIVANMNCGDDDILNEAANVLEAIHNAVQSGFGGGVKSPIGIVIHHEKYVPLDVTVWQDLIKKIIDLSPNFPAGCTKRLLKPCFEAVINSDREKNPLLPILNDIFVSLKIRGEGQHSDNDVYFARGIEVCAALFEISSLNDYACHGFKFMDTLYWGCGSDFLVANLDNQLWVAWLNLLSTVLSNALFFMEDISQLSFTRGHDFVQTRAVRILQKEDTSFPAHYISMPRSDDEPYTAEMLVNFSANSVLGLLTLLSKTDFTPENCEDHCQVLSACLSLVEEILEGLSFTTNIADFPTSLNHFLSNVLSQAHRFLATCLKPQEGMSQEITNLIEGYLKLIRKMVTSDFYGGPEKLVDMNILNPEDVAHFKETMDSWLFLEQILQCRDLFTLEMNANVMDTVALATCPFNHTAPTLVCNGDEALCDFKCRMLTAVWSIALRFPSSANSSTSAELSNLLVSLATCVRNLIDVRPSHFHALWNRAIASLRHENDKTTVTRAFEGLIYQSNDIFAFHKHDITSWLNSIQQGTFTPAKHNNESLRQFHTHFPDFILTFQSCDYDL